MTKVDDRCRGCLLLTDDPKDQWRGGNESCRGTARSDRDGEGLDWCAALARRLKGEEG